MATRCLNCGSEHTKEYKVLSEGRETTICLCDSCYRKMYGEKQTDMFTQFLANAGGKAVKRCPSCGMEWGEFRKTGLLGCAGCYSAFREELLNSIRYCQRDVVHRGKAPTGRAEINYDYMRELVREKDAVIARIDRALLDGDYTLLKALEEKLKAIKRELNGEIE